MYSVHFSFVCATVVLLAAVVSYVNAGSLVSIGCFKDKDDAHALSDIVFSGTLTRATFCVEACRRKGFRYAGCQDGNTCYCGDGQYDMYGVANRECTVRTIKEFEYPCGNVQRNSIYDTQLGFHAVTRHTECVKDNTAARIMDIVTFFPPLGFDNSNFRCAEACNINGYVYANTQYQNGCNCANYADKSFETRPWDQYGLAGLTECGSLCPSLAFANERCGGYARATISYGYYVINCTKMVLTNGNDGVVYASKQTVNISSFSCLSKCCLEGFPSTPPMKYKQAAINNQGVCFCSNKFPVGEKAVCSVRCTSEFEMNHFCGGEDNVYVVMTPANVRSCLDDACNGRGKCVATTGVLTSNCVCNKGFCGEHCELTLDEASLKSSDGRRLDTVSVSWSTAMLLFVVSVAGCRVMTTIFQE